MLQCEERLLDVPSVANALGGTRAAQHHDVQTTVSNHDLFDRCVLNRVY